MTQTRRASVTPLIDTPKAAVPPQSANELARLRNALDLTSAGLWDWSSRTQGLQLDTRAQALVHLADAQVGQSSLAAVELLIHQQDLNTWRTAWQELLGGRSDGIDCQTRLARGAKDWQWVNWRGRVMARDGLGEAEQVAGVVTDIHALKQAQDQLGALVQRDPLTDLPNRVLLAERLQHAVASARRNRSTFVVMEVLLEGVAPINEALGVEMGHHVIRQAARRMATCTRASDLVARTGDNAFVLLLDNVEGTEDAMAVADKLRHHISEPLVVDGHWLQVSASVGMAMYPTHGNSAAEVQAHAVQAQAEAVSAGGDRVVLFKASSESTPPTPTTE